MDSDADTDNAEPIGRSLHAEGVITLRRRDTTLARLRSGMDIYEGEEITTTGSAHATIEFTDRSKLAINPTTSIRFDRYIYDCKHDDICRIKLFHGVIALLHGRIASEPDALIIDAGPMVLNVHAASMICRLSPNGIKADVTLLTTSSQSCGEILVHNNVAVETLNAPNHTLRIDGRHGYVTKPMTVTSNVLREYYTGLAIDPILDRFAAIDRDDDDPDAGGMFSAEPKGFELFRDLDDRLLERRFLTQHIYPGDRAQDDLSHNDLLEDVFEGERFRLKPKS